MKDLQEMTRYISNLIVPLSLSRVRLHLTNIDISLLIRLWRRKKSLSSKYNANRSIKVVDSASENFTKCETLITLY